MLCVPVVNVEVANVATPAETVPDPITVPPSLNCTVPVVEPPETVAVKVVGVVPMLGLILEVNVVVVGVDPVLTVWEILLDKLAASLASPLYSALMLRTPPPSDEVVSVATPAFKVTVPIT